MIQRSVGGGFDADCDVCGFVDWIDAEYHKEVVAQLKYEGWRQIAVEGRLVQACPECVRERT